MKKLCTLLACSSFFSVHAQTIIYSENFEGASPTFTLNTADLSSATSGYNTWIINNSYTGGSFNDNDCGTGTLSIATTPSQPGTITNAPNSKYMHITNLDASSQGVSNANFAASDGAIFCHDDENNFTKMTSDISTSGQTGVIVSFYWMCDGSANNYGELYYSTDGGTSWNLQQGGMQNQASWTQATITNAVFDNKPTLRFGFRFVNTLAFSASDPPLCVDEFVVSVPAAATITTGNITGGSPYCAGENLIVPYTITGTFNGSNTFTAELSDGSGSFASPVAIGNVVSSSSGNINCNIPANTPTGTGYLIRVTGTQPMTTGSTSGPITINALPSVTAGNSGPYCAGNTINLTATAGSASYGWAGPLSYTSSSQNPTIPSSTTGMSGSYTVTATSTAGCTSTSSTVVTVNSCAGIEDEEMAQVSIYPNPATDAFTLSINENMVGDARVSVINLVGEVVYTMTPNQSKNMISTEALGLKSGIYLVQVRYHDQAKVVRLIVR